MPATVFEPLLCWIRGRRAGGHEWRLQCGLSDFSCPGERGTWDCHCGVTVTVTVAATGTGVVDSSGHAQTVAPLTQWRSGDCGLGPSDGSLSSVQSPQSLGE